MTSVINDNGEAIAVTLLSASPNIIAGLKTDDKDGYTAVQVGFEQAKMPAKAQLGQFKDLDIMPKIIREFRLNEIDENTKIGDKLSADLFSVGDSVDARGVTKGKGFAGTIKRHNFKRGRKTHGGRSYRRPGSIGSMYPQHIFKGKKMAGQMGHTRVTTKKLKIAFVDNDLKVIGVVGSVPGPKKGIVLLKETK